MYVDGMSEPGIKAVPLISILPLLYARRSCRFFFLPNAMTFGKPEMFSICLYL